MGRPRLHDTGLPKRLLRRRGKFYYVTGRVWTPLGADEAEARAKAEALNRADADSRQQALTLARDVCAAIRAEIMERDGCACVYCGATESLELDHIIPVASGGATTRNNLVVACSACNMSKSDLGMADFFAKLHRVVERILEAKLAA